MRIYSTWPLPDSAIQLLQEHAIDFKANDSGQLLLGKDLYEANEDIDGLITLLTDSVDQRLLEKNKSLKIIANVAVGYNNIDIKSAVANNIIVTNTPDILTDATANLAAALLLSTARRIVESDHFIRENNFTGWRPDLFLGRAFNGKVLGIYGMGKIGRALAKRMNPFGLNIIYNNRQAINPSEEELLKAKYVDFNELLAASDYLCVLAPLTEETQNRFSDGEFARMKKGAFFFNIARGPIMDEKALVRALKTGQLSGAGLDVYENEPRIEPDLLKMENVVLLPHIGSAEDSTREEMFLLAVKNVVEVLNGRKPLTPVY